MFQQKSCFVIIMSQSPPPPAYVSLGSRFGNLLRRLRSTDPSAADIEAISRISDSDPRGQRIEQVIPRTDPVIACIPFADSYARYETLTQGLRAHGLAVVENGPVFARGAFAEVLLAYRLLSPEQGAIPLEPHHLVIAKIQEQTKNRLQIFKEVSVLRGVNHSHIIDILGVFHAHDTGQAVILLEYATAGTLSKELERYPMQSLGKESHARYYIRQICSGIQYLHSKEVTHNDLHLRNILLKYTPGGYKKCMIADLGCAVITRDDPNLVVSPLRFLDDVHMIRLLAMRMMRDIGNKSADARSFINRRQRITTVTELMSHVWLQGRAKPPKRHTPSPLLKADVVPGTGYMYQDRPTGAARPAYGPPSPTLMQRTRVRLASVNQRLRERRHGQRDVVAQHEPAAAFQESLCEPLLSDAASVPDLDVSEAAEQSMDSSRSVRHGIRSRLSAAGRSIMSHAFISRRRRSSSDQ